MSVQIRSQMVCGRPCRFVAVGAIVAAVGLALAPVHAHAATCVDNKPASGFSFTCDSALAAPPPGMAYPTPDGVSFTVAPIPPDSNSTVAISSFSLPFQCAKIEGSGTPVDYLNCGAPVAAGQTVSGTIAWQIGFHPSVPVGNCIGGQVDGFLAGGDTETVSFPIQLCQSSGSQTAPPKRLTASSAKSAATAALLAKFGKSWRKGSSKKLACSPLGTTFDCKVSWRYGAKRHKGHATVSQTAGKVHTRLRVH